MDSENSSPEVPKPYKKALPRVTRANRRLSRKVGSKKGQEPSRNFMKQQARLAKLSRHVANQRKDFLHKLSTSIAKRYDLVCFEDLSIKDDMLISKAVEPCRRKRNNINRAILENGWYNFTIMLDYKMGAKGGYLIKVDKDYPSTQTCPCCGHLESSVKDLAVRKWTCPACGIAHDRDHNAALNIRDEGINRLLAS